MTEVKTILGGITDGRIREIDVDNPFEVDCYAMFSELILNGPFAVYFWGSLANVVWENKEKGQIIGYSFRAAGELICALRGSGDYLTWYCSMPSGVVDSRISEALASRGWTFKISATGGI